MLGMDRKSEDYSDFGGGRKRRETFFFGAFRECSEETEDLIKYNSDEVETVLSVMYHEIAVVFLPLQLDEKHLELIPKLFQLRAKEDSEMSHIKWFDLDSFLHLIFKPDKLKMNMYYVIRTALFGIFDENRRQKHLSILTEYFKTSAYPYHSIEYLETLVQKYKIQTLNFNKYSNRICQEIVHPLPMELLSAKLQLPMPLPIEIKKKDVVKDKKIQSPLFICGQI